MRPLVAILLAAGCLPAQTGGVAGTVVDQTGQPLAGVHVRMIASDFATEDPKLTTYGAISDKAGHYSADGLPSSLYFVMAERTGFVQQGSTRATLAVQPGEVADYKIVMAARALIAGHVVDEFGDPVQHINVQIESARPNDTQGFGFGRPYAQTDDRGEFRLVMGPGKYNLRAQPQGIVMRFGQQEIRTDGTPSAPFVTTYYPGAASSAAASVIEVAAGQELAGMDIRLLRAAPETARTFTVSGSVTGVPENQRATVMLRFGDHPNMYFNGRGQTADADGTFKISGMEPGFYSVTASADGGKTPLQSRAFEFHLESADQTGIQLTLAPGEELTGKLELTGDPAAGEAAKHTVRLESESGTFGRNDPPAAEVAPDGSFHIAEIRPGKFKLVVEPMPENSFLKEIALDGKSVPENVLDFTQGVGGSRLKITVSRSGGRISGRVLNSEGKLAIGMTMVFLARDADHMDERDPLRTIDGKFELKGIRPGKYRILALDVAQLAVAFNGDGDRDEVMQKLFDGASEVEVKEGDTISKDVTVVSKMPEKKEQR